MAILASEMFRRDPSQTLDFSEGSLDLTDFFNNLMVPTVNALEPEYLDPNATDPFVEQANRDAMLAPQFGPVMQFGFEAPTQQLNEVPDTQSGPTPTQESPRVQSYSTPLSSASVSTQPRPSSGSFDPASFTFEREARRDSSGNLRVYNPPSGDGGGAYEVAGITARYQPQEASRLRSLISSGRNSEAEEEAKAFFRRRAAPYTQHAESRGLQLQLADTVHHRGEGGLRRVLQRATGSNSKSYEALIKQLDTDPQALEKFNRARVDYELQEVDRGRASRAKFRQGLLNRFDAAYKASVAANQ